MLLLFQAGLFKCSVIKPIDLSREWDGFSVPGAGLSCSFLKGGEVERGRMTSISYSESKPAFLLLL